MATSKNGVWYAYVMKASTEDRAYTWPLSKHLRNNKKCHDSWKVTVVMPCWRQAGENTIIKMKEGSDFDFYQFVRILAKYEEDSQAVREK